MLHTILVDDENLALILLEKKLQEFPCIHIVKTYTDYTEVLQNLKTTKIDVAFLDIELDSMSGLDLADMILSLNSTIEIVFVSAHMEYAVQAFEINSIDYLLKPVTSKRLQMTVNRLLEKKNTSKIENENKTEDAANANLKVTCFLEFQVFYNEQPVHFKTAKVKELFAFLLTHRNTYVNRDIIIDKLWPEQDYKKSKINLHTSLSHLRKKLNDLGYPNCLTYMDQSYSLSIEPVDCDVIELEKALQALENLDDKNILDAERVLQLYKGSFMELNGYEWILEKSIEYQGNIIDLLQKVIEYYQEYNVNKAIYYLQMLLKINPYSDEHIKECMELHILQGNRGEAIRMYQEYEQLLSKDLGIKPENSLTNLYKSLFYKNE